MSGTVRPQGKREPPAFRGADTQAGAVRRAVSYGAAEDAASPREPLAAPLARRMAPPGARQGQPGPAADAPHGNCCRGCAASDAAGALWWARIPGRLWSVLVAVTLPLRVLVWVLDGIVAASVVVVLAVVWAWWTQYITDDQVAQVLGQIGQRGLSVLGKAGII